MPIVAGLAAPEVVFIGLMVILLLYSTRQLWVPFIILLLSQIPLIGNWAAQHVAQLIGVAFAWVESVAVHLMQPVIDLVFRLASRIFAFTGSALGALQVTFNALFHIAQVLIPAAVLQVRLYAEYLYNQAIIAATALQQAVRLYAEYLYNRAVIEATALQQALKGYVDSQLNSLGNGLRAALAALLAAVGLQIQDAINTAHKEAQQVAADAAAGAAAIAAADAAAIRASNDLARTLSADVAAAAAAGTAEAEALARALNKQAIAYAGAIGLAVGAELQAIKDLPCIQVCNPLGQLGNELDALDLGVLLAMLLGMAANPREGARAFSGMIGPGAQGAAAELGSIFGGVH